MTEYQLINICKRCESRSCDMCEINEELQQYEKNGSRHMTNQEAIKTLSGYDGIIMYPSAERESALKKAIEALEEMSKTEDDLK